jgi:uncharacterized protein
VIGVAVECVDSLDQVPPARWNALPGAGSFYLSHRWLRFVENEGTARTRYLLASADGRLASALPTYAVAVETNHNYSLPAISGGRLADRYLIAGTRRAYVNDLMHDPPPADVPDPTLEALLSAGEHEAGRSGLAGVAFLYIGTATARRLLRVRPAARPLLVGIDAELTLPGHGFDDYLAAVGGRRAYAIRRERRRFAETGYTVSVERLADCWYELGPLVANVQQRYGHPDTAADCRAGLRAQAEVAGEHSLVFCARRDGRLLAGALFFAWRDTLHGRVVGFDYPALAGAGEYFSLYFYEPLAYAYQHGFHTLHLGKGSLAAKLRRGARPVGRWAVILPPTDVPGDWRERNREILRRAEQDEELDGVDVPADWV